MSEQIEFVAIADPALIYVGVADRSEFDKIGRPCTDHGDNGHGHVMTKTVEEGGCRVIFQFWVKNPLGRPLSDKGEQP
ncbi:MAG: hypothetical protein QOD40_569 [Alphaproteobacteria bacterium]|jgi:hypothetical protein|nr:hypothetical protein [Alphaproteobacteria bacterium]